MEMYKEASRRKLRFNTVKGSLSVEQLWQLSDDELTVLINSLEETVEKTSKKNYFKKVSNTNKTAKLRLDIVLDVINTIVDERENDSKAKIVKDRKERALEIRQRVVQNTEEKAIGDMNDAEFDTYMADLEK